jgi:hypothetical protein
MEIWSMSELEPRRSIMDKIYRRSSLVANTQPKKTVKKRKRNIIVNFRMSLEEKKILDNRIELSGMKKQDYFIQSCLHQRVQTFGNVKSFDAIRKRMQLIEQHILSLSRVDELDYEVLESLRMVLEMLDGLYSDLDNKS